MSRPDLEAGVGSQLTETAIVQSQDINQAIIEPLVSKILEEAVQQGRLKPETLYRVTGFRLYRLIIEANTVRRELGLPQITTRLDRIAVVAERVNQLDTVVHRFESHDLRKKRVYYQYLVEVEKTQQTLFLLATDRDLPTKPGGRSRTGALYYCQTVFYPNLSDLFDRQIPTQEQVIIFAQERIKKILDTYVRKDNLWVGEAQDLALQILRKLSPYIVGVEGEFTNSIQFSSFISLTCQNALIDHKKKRGRVRPVTYDEERSFTTEEGNVENPWKKGGEHTFRPEEDEIMDALSLDEVAEMLATYPAQLAAMQLNAQGYTNAEIAQILSQREGKGVSEIAVKSRLHRARGRVKVIVAPKENKPPQTPQEFISQLPERYQRPAELYLEGRSYKEIATIISQEKGKKITVGMVSWWVRYFRKKLREQFPGQDLDRKKRVHRKKEVVIYQNDESPSEE